MSEEDWNFLEEVKSDLWSSPLASDCAQEWGSLLVYCEAGFLSHCYMWAFDGSGKLVYCTWIILTECKQVDFGCNKFICTKKNQLYSTTTTKLICYVKCVWSVYSLFKRKCSVVSWCKQIISMVHCRVPVDCLSEQKLMSRMQSVRPFSPLGGF